VLGILGERPGIKFLKVEVEGGEAKAISYDWLTGPVKVGDWVTLNTTAVHLRLGTGGWHFVIQVGEGQELDPKTPGHIMKLRYTPLQIKVPSVEEPASPYHRIMTQHQDLDGMPVVVGTLHSQLLPAAAAARKVQPQARIAYVMTDGACLPAPFSDTLSHLQKRGLLCGSITVGHAFGGDLEAVSIYSGLIAARWVLKADLTIVTMGPGTVGTATPLGSTSLEQGPILDGVSALGGRGIALLRISFADERPRHRGVSHHCLTALGTLTQLPTTVVVPKLPRAMQEYIADQLKLSRIAAKHQVVEWDGDPGLEALRAYDLQPTTMGRGIDEDREFFLSACAAGSYAAHCLDPKE
jgi:hypothetical protein